MSHTYTYILTHALFGTKESTGSNTIRGRFLCEDTPDDARFAGSIENYSCVRIDPWLARHGLNDDARFAG